MTNAELIKALRYCVVHPYRPCDGCVLFETDGCINVLHGAAADALEAAEKRIAELMPKEGEWIDEQRGRWIYAKCNLCGKVQDVRSNYCPNCGARMRGEHDE